MNRFLKALKFCVILFCITVFAFSDSITVMAAGSLTVTSDKKLTTKFNKYETVTIAKGKTLTLSKSIGEPIGLEITKKLVVEDGGKITGDGLLIFDRNATYSGITLYYKYQGKVYAIPSEMGFRHLSADVKDYKPEFVFDSKNDRYILNAEFGGGDPFEVEFKDRELTLLKGEKKQLDLSGITKGITWSSSDKNVASISQTGLLTANNFGTATITATYNGKTKNCMVEVVQKGLSFTQVHLEAGQSFMIKLYGTSVKSVSSSNKAVATIDQKLELKAVKDGKCTVTVVGTDDKKYTCTVEVGNQGAPAEPADNNNNANNNNNNVNNVDIKVVKNTVKYSTLKKASGTYRTGQLPAGILSGFKAANGKTGMNHPNGIASDGTHLVVCDTWNNRVLIYNSLPSGGESPDVVLGQKDFKSFDAGNGKAQMNWPVGAAFAGGKLFITDTNNYRVLVYNSVPTKSGAKPDYIIDRIDETHSTAWPWGIWSDGKKLVLTCTRSGKVAIWNDAAKAAAGKYADIILEGMGTPRTIVSDGKFLLIGDHNVVIDGRSVAGSYVWKKFPKNSSSKPDFVLNTQYSGAIIEGNTYLRDASSNYYVYNGVIDSAKEKCVEQISVLNCCLAGDYNDLLYVGGKTYASCYNSSYIAIYNGKVTSKNAEKPDGYLGVSKKVTSANVARGLYQNPIAATDGKSLVIADDFNRLLAVYKSIPDTDSVRADIEYKFDLNLEYPIDVDIDAKGKMYVLTPISLLVWNKVPVNGEKYNVRYDFGTQRGIGNTSKLAVDSKHIYIFSDENNEIYEFALGAKDFKLGSAGRKLEYSQARDIFSNGKFLVVTNQNENKIDIFNVSNLTLKGTVKSKSFDEGVMRIARPASAIILPDGRFVVANTDMNNVLIYANAAAAIKDSNKYQVKLGDNGAYKVKHYNNFSVPMEEITSVATKSTLVMPSSLLYKDGHLWVGEYKFSSRLFRYDEK